MGEKILLDISQAKSIFLGNKFNASLHYLSFLLILWRCTEMLFFIQRVNFLGFRMILFRALGTLIFNLTNACTEIR